MRLISAKDQDYLKGYFAKELVGAVKLVYLPSGSRASSSQARSASSARRPDSFWRR